MEAHDYPIAHFELMTKVAGFLKSKGVQLLEAEYSYKVFGLWSFTFQIKGQNYRILRDGRDFVLTLATDIGGSAPFSNKWGELVIVPIEGLREDVIQKEVEVLIEKAIGQA